MGKIKFREIRLNLSNKERLELINSIIEEYQADGYKLTLRQLYYQLVSRDVIPNVQSEYAKLSTLLKEGRMGGIIDWNAIEDRLRRPRIPYSVRGPKAALEETIWSYALPRMEGQLNYIEVWVEKDALSGVLSRVTNEYHIPILVNRGYSSVTAMYDAYVRFYRAHGEEALKSTILYLGDFDPSGLDMIRDIEDRLHEFINSKFYSSPSMSLEVVPIALTEKQIKKYNPPPNPTKVTDPRAKDYIKKYGRTCWEVDALPPKVLNTLLEKAIKKRIDLDLYEEIVSKELDDIEKLEKVMAKMK